MTIVFICSMVPKTLGSHVLRAAETLSLSAYPTLATSCSPAQCEGALFASAWLTGTQVNIDLASVTAPPDCEPQATSLGAGYASEQVIWVFNGSFRVVFQLNGMADLIAPPEPILSEAPSDFVANVGTNLAAYRGTTLACLDVAYTAIDGYSSYGWCELGMSSSIYKEKYIAFSTPIRFLGPSFLTVSSSRIYFAPSILKALSASTCEPSMTITCMRSTDGRMPIQEVWQGVQLTFNAEEVFSPPDCARPLESLGPGYSGSSKFFTFTNFAAGEISLRLGSDILIDGVSTLPLLTDSKMSYLAIDSQMVGCLTSLYYLANSYVVTTSYTYCNTITDQAITQVFTFDSFVTDTGQQPFVLSTNGQILAIADIQTQISRLSSAAVSASLTRTSTYTGAIALPATLIPLADSNSELSQAAKITLTLAVCMALALAFGFLAFFVWRRYSVLYGRNKGVPRVIASSITGPVLRRNSLKGQHMAHPKLPPVKKKKNWRAPLMMLGSIVFGLAFSIGHHLFYQSIHGYPVQNIRIPQSWVFRIGNLLAFVVKVSLSISVGIAFVQLQWIKIRQRPLRVVDIDTISSALGNFLVFGSSSIWIQYPVMTLMAIICWSYPIVPVITPGTINVLADSYTNLTQLQTPQLFINPPTWATEDTIDLPDGNMPPYGTPLLSRMVMATAFLGSILPIQVDYTNTTYHLELFAPAVKCESPDNSTLSYMLEWLPDPITQFYTYYSWVPVNNISSKSPPSCGSDTDNLDVISQDHARLYIATNDGTIPSVNLTECGLYNASYSVDFAFEQSQQIITIQNVSYLNGIPCNSVGTDDNIEDIEYGNQVDAYAALMTTFSSLFVGSISYTLEPAGWTGKSRNCTSIEYLVMDLFMSDDIGRIQHEPNTLENFQRSIEKLFHNITISLLHDAAFQKPASEAEMIPVNITTALTTYHYASSELVLTYTIAILITLLCCLLGFHAFLVNEGSYQNIFSTYLRATRNLEFTIENEDTGTDPCPRDLSRALVVMKQSTIESYQAYDSEERKHLIARKPVPARQEAPS